MAAGAASAAATAGRRYQPPLSSAGPAACGSLCSEGCSYIVKELHYLLNDSLAYCIISLYDQDSRQEI